MTSAAIGTVFVQETAEATSDQWRNVDEQFREKLAKLSAMKDAGEHDVLAFMNILRAHWSQISSIDLLERLNAEITRRTNVVGIRQNDASVISDVRSSTLSPQCVSAYQSCGLTPRDEKSPACSQDVSQQTHQAITA